MKVYFIKIALRGVSPMVWRRLRVPGSASLAMLHDCIQIINSWDDDYLHQFHIYGKDYGLNYPGGLNYSDNVHEIYLDDFQFDIGDKFTYEYNFFEHLIHDIRIENIRDFLPTKNNVICLSGQGMPSATKSDVMDVEFKFLERIVENNGLTSADIDEFREKINRVKFNKKSVNSNLLSSIKI